MAELYILEGEDGRYYIGSTVDLRRRMDQHKSGHTWTTQRIKNPSLVFHQEYQTLAEARKIELKLKKLKRKDYIRKIIEDGSIKMSPD